MSKPKEQPDAELPEALRGRRVLKPSDSFSFGCHAEIPCFTRCCADINILLTPVDVLRLSRRLGLKTDEFLDQYTLLPITKDLHLPVVMLRMGDDPDKKCQLVGEAGCTVYEDRPWSCRMYPVGSALPPARAGVEPQPIYCLIEDEFCEGHKEQRSWTVESWRADQHVEEQEALEAGFRELVSHPWFIGGRQLNPKQMEAFYSACYDLDSFRRFIFESTFLQRFEMEDELVEKIEKDDDALLQFAYRWLRFALFGEPTVTTRAEAAAAATGDVKE